MVMLIAEIDRSQTLAIGENLRLNWECSFVFVGPLRLMENDAQLLLSKDPS